MVPVKCERVSVRHKAKQYEYCPQFSISLSVSVEWLPALFLYSFQATSHVFDPFQNEIRFATLARTQQEYPCRDSWSFAFPISTVCEPIQIPSI